MVKLSKFQLMSIVVATNSMDTPPSTISLPPSLTAPACRPFAPLPSPAPAPVPPCRKAPGQAGQTMTAIHSVACMAWVALRLGPHYEDKTEFVDAILRLD